MTSVIEVQHLKKSFQTENALEDVTFSINKGEIFGFLGPNGAGKSTTIKILTGQLLPSSGTAEIMGLSISKNKQQIMKKIGIVPENSNLYERLTIMQNLNFFCRLYDCSSEAAENFLEEVKLTNEKNTVVKKLSKGMKQKILLIRALLHKPKLLFLDEPTSGLDPSSANDIHKMLTRLNNEGVTILLTSHNMEEVEKLCHRVSFLDNGKIAATGSPVELKLKYSQNQVKVLLEKDNGFDEQFIELNGAQSAGIMSQWMTEGKIKSIHSCEPTLADIFMRVTGRDFE